MSSSDQEKLLSRLKKLMDDALDYYDQKRVEEVLVMTDKTDKRIRQGYRAIPP